MRKPVEARSPLKFLRYPGFFSTWFLQFRLNSSDSGQKYPHILPRRFWKLKPPAKSYQTCQSWAMQIEDNNRKGAIRSSPFVKMMKERIFSKIHHFIPGHCIIEYKNRTTTILWQFTVQITKLFLAPCAMFLSQCNFNCAFK